MISGEAAPRPFIKAGAERSGGAGGGGGGGGAAADMTHFILLPAALHTSKLYNKPPEKHRLPFPSVYEMTLEDC